MNNIQSDFKAKAKMNTGFYNRNGTPSRAFGPQMQMEVTGGAKQPSAPPNSGPKMPVAPAPANSGPKMPVAPAAPNSGPQQPNSLLSRAGRVFERGVQPPDWKGLGQKALGATKSATSGLLRNMNTASNTIAAGDDIGAVLAAPNADVFEKVGGTAEALGNVAGGFLMDTALKAAGLVAPGLAGAANMGLTNSRPVTALSRLINGKSAIDNIREDAGFGEPKNPMRLIGETAMSVAGEKPSTPTPAGATLPSAQQAKPLSPELQAVKDSTFDPNANPFTRRATPEAEFARQQGNGRMIEATDMAFQERRGGFKSGNAAFGDDATRALFNTRNELEGTGIKATVQSNGNTMFSNLDTNGNPNQARKMYRAADGSITDDWSKTKDYADAIQRNAQDQSRLAEMTRGAALSGDRDAVDRLTRGDGRLQAIAQQAGTERDLRQAVRGGSAKAAQVLASMEQAQANKGLAGAELALRAEDIRGRAEDRDLDRSFKAQTQRAAALAASRAVEKDARDNAQALEEKEYSRLKDISTVDGKTNPALLSANQGVAAQYGSTGDPALDLRDKLVQARLQSNIAGGQAFYDRAFSSPVGTEVQPWHVNEGWGRGGYKTEDGKHLSEGQLRSLPIDEQQAFFGTVGPDGKPLMNGRLKMGKVPQWYIDRMKGGK